jgi:predicted amidophosphoribosyltransferase
MRDRGYNQSALLAKEVAASVGLPVHNALERTWDTPAQVDLAGREQRALNVHQGFRCKMDVRGWKVILVDDAVTSGSTMAACAQALKEAGAASVWGIALAR